MAEPRTLSVIVNGEPHQTTAPQTLLTLLEQLGEPIDKAVVEHNGSYVRRPDLSAVKLSNGDQIEVILPAFGG